MKKQMIAAPALALVVALMAATPALANEAPQPGHDHKARGEERFKASDTNGDGALSRDEFLTENTRRASEMYAKLDSNNDGKLTQEEMKAGHEKMRAKMKERWQEKKEGIKPE